MALALGGMLLVPLLTLLLVIAFVPAFRPWSHEAPSAPGGPPASAAPRDSDRAELGGRIVDGDGEPVAGARVVLLGPPPAFASLKETRSDARGAFAFAELWPTRVRVMAEHDEKGVVVSAELSLAPGARVVDLVLALLPARAVRGKITDEDGRAVGGAQVLVEGLPPGLSRQTVSDKDGLYRASRVPQGASRLKVTASGYAAAFAPLAKSVGEGDEEVNVQLRKEPDVEGVVLDPEGKPLRAAVYACEGKDAAHRTISDREGHFRFPRDIAACTLMALHDSYAASDPVAGDAAGLLTLNLRPGGGIAGTVVDDTGSAVPSFFVGVESFTPSVGAREFSVRSDTARPFADPNGAFLLEKLAPGSYVLSVSAEGRSATRSSSIDVAAGQVTARVRIVLSRGGSIEGQVFDDADRKPVAGARVLFDATTSTERETVPPATTDEAGRYRLENAPSGPFSLRVEKTGYRARIVAGLKVESGRVISQDVGLNASGDAGAKLEFGGIGAVLSQTREGISLGSVFEGSPAERAGVQQGDLLRKINGESIEGQSVADAIQRLRGEPGVVVRLTIQRPASGEVIDFAIRREAIVR